MEAGATAGVQSPSTLGRRPVLVQQNRPNPFNPSTVIRYTLAADSPVSIAIMTPLGRHVVTLLEEAQSAGTHSVTWNGRDRVGNQAASGVYFYRVKVGEQEASRKMLLTK